MAVWDKKILWGFMLMLAGAGGQSVNYSDPVCAVKGSTVTLLCSFTPLKTFTEENGRQVPLEIVRVRWCQNHPICQGLTPSVYDSESVNNDHRYKYLGDKKGNCTLQITDIQKSDNATFRFRMEVNYTRGHFTGQSGVNVTVTDPVRMRINSSSADGEMRRGESVTLYCTAVCTIHQLEVTWFKDNHALSESGPALQLGPLTAKDSGNYTCGLRTDTLSLPYSLHVEAEEEGGNMSLIVGVAFGVLLALTALIVVLCVIKRRRAADKGHRAVGGETEQKHPDNIYSHTVTVPEEEGGSLQPQTSAAENEVSYASVQFKQKQQTRPAKEAEDAIIYSSVAGRG
ncbi:coxsackievirus and adenovirus receptor homolog [Morone saxatilis]|uniref:coxsackievirus and adenovirus receptor homolog n=1 Tax=Morone saxatilis TaxID=34816 RepID=UPI0015E2120A|nr:coxsackievirus and adenovirus receptor homolog [Morone saxatilis]